MTYYPSRSTTIQNFSTIAQTMVEIWATRVFQSLALIFDPSWSSKVKFDDANRKPVGPTYKCSLWFNVVSVTVFEIFRLKILTVDLLTFISTTCLSACVDKKQVRQLSGLAYIPTCRSPSPQIVYNTGRHRVSGGLFVTRSATVGQVCRTGLTTVERVIDFSIFDLGGLPLRHVWIKNKQ